MNLRNVIVNIPQSLEPKSAVENAVFYKGFVGFSDLKFGALLLCDLAMLDGQYQQAVENVLEQNPDYTGETLSPGNIVMKN